MTLTGVLFLIFLVLKLTGVIAWSWVWVFAPIWGSAVLFLVFALGGTMYVYLSSRGE